MSVSFWKRPKRRDVPRLVAIVAAQEVQWVFTAKNRSTKPGMVSFDFVKSRPRRRRGRQPARRPRRPVRAGPSGALTRGWAYVLPTGQSVSSVDRRCCRRRSPSRSEQGWPTLSPSATSRVQGDPPPSSGSSRPRGGPLEARRRDRRRAAACAPQRLTGGRSPNERAPPGPGRCRPDGRGCPLAPPQRPGVGWRGRSAPTSSLMRWTTRAPSRGLLGSDLPGSCSRGAKSPDAKHSREPTDPLSVGDVGLSTRDVVPVPGLSSQVSIASSTT